jgi:phage terminase small subunit
MENQDKPQPLNNKQHESFIRYYVYNGFNATQAAISAGYSQRSAGQQASKLLRKDNIQQRKDELIEEKWGVEKNTLIEQTRDEIKKIAFSSLPAYLDDDGLLDIDKIKQNPSAIKKLEITENQGERSSSSNTKFELHDKVRALNLLAKILGMEQPTQIEHSGEVKMKEILHDPNFKPIDK